MDEAVTSYHKALAINPDYDKAHSNLGLVLQEQGKLDEAVISYHKAIVINPDYAKTHYNLGIVLYEQGKLDDAVASAPFGGHAVNLAAITTAICAGEDAHPDPDKRYWSAIIGGITYIIFGLTTGAAIAFITLSPPILIAAVAGLALFGALTASLVSSLSSETDREAAFITFLITASGLTIFGISGVFWGLLAGGAFYLWDHRKNS